MAPVFLFNHVPHCGFIKTRESVFNVISLMFHADLLHQPLIGGTVQGPASDLEIHARDIIELKKKMYKLYANRTGSEESVFATMMERDAWVSPEAAIDFGLISRIITKRSDLEFK